MLQISTTIYFITHVVKVLKENEKKVNGVITRKKRPKECVSALQKFTKDCIAQTKGLQRPIIQR